MVQLETQSCFVDEEQAELVMMREMLGALSHAFPRFPCPGEVETLLVEFSLLEMEVDEASLKLITGSPV